MTKLRKILLGLGIVLLIYTINQFLLGGLQLITVLYFSFAVSMLVKSIRDRKQGYITRGEKGVLVGAGGVMLLTAVFGFSVIFNNLPHWEEVGVGVFELLIPVVMVLILGLAILLVGIRAPRSD